MEETDIKIAKAIKKLESSPIHEELDSFLLELEKKQTEDLLSTNHKEDIRKIDREVWRLISSSLCGTTDKTNEIAELIFTSKKYLLKGVLKNDIKALLVFLSVNCYLKLDVNQVLPKEKTAKLKLEAISNKIISLLSKLTLTINVPEDAPYYEKELLLEYEEGIKEKNIQKTYNLLQAIEQSNRGFHINYLLKELVIFLYNISFDTYKKLLTLYKEPNEFVFLLQDMDLKKLLKVANSHSLENEWLNFEIIRQIVKDDGISDAKTKALYSTLKRIKNKNWAFFKQSVEYFSSSKLFNAALGELSGCLSNSQLDEIISECFAINKYNSHLEAKDKFWAFFNSTVSDDKVAYTANLIEKKWKNYFYDILNTNDYVNEVILTDYANIVVDYYTYLIEGDELKEMMKKLIEKVKFINSEWTTTHSQLITKFYLYHSQLHLLTYSFRKKELEDDLILANYKQLIELQVLPTRFNQEKDKSFFERGYQNIDWRNQ